MTVKNTKVNTLQDVAHLVPQLYSASSAKVYAAALKRVEKLLGRGLSQIAADEAAWDSAVKGFVWAGHFSGRTPAGAERAYEAWVAKIRAAIRAATAFAAPAPTATSARADWDLVAGYVADVENTSDGSGAPILPNQASVSIANLRARLGDTAPASLDGAAAQAALTAAPADKVATLRRSLRFFNRLIRERARHPAIAHLLPEAEVGALPLLRDAPLDWSRLDPGFVAAIDRAIDAAIQNGRRRRDRHGGRLGADPMAHRGRTRGAKRIRNVESARTNFRNAISWLIRHAWEDRGAAARELGSFHDLMTPEVIERATDRYIARAQASDALLDPSRTATGSGMLTKLETIAKRNALADEVLWSIEDCAAREEIDTPQDREMSRARLEFVRLLDGDPAVVRAIIRAPATLLCEARSGLSRWERLGEIDRIRVCKAAMVAAMFAVQLARPLRTKNLNELSVGGAGADLRLPRRAGATALIAIDRTSVKNRKEIEHDLPPHLWRVVETWLNEFRPRYIELNADRGVVDGPSVFPGAAGALSRQMFNKTWNRGAASIGVPGLTPHMMRHVAATIFLAKNPGQYAVVAALLRDKVDTVEKFYIRGEGRHAAELFAATLSEINPAAGAIMQGRAA